MAATIHRESEARLVLSSDELSETLAAPDAGEVQRMSLAGSFLLMVGVDMRRPFQLAKLRRRLMASAGERILSLGGLLSSGDAALETVINLVRRQSWLMAKMAFLDRINQVFQFWHVLHRPVSDSVAVVAVMHITLVLLMGYY